MTAPTLESPAPVTAPTLTPEPVATQPAAASEPNPTLFDLRNPGTTLTDPIAEPEVVPEIPVTTEEAAPETEAEPAAEPEAEEPAPTFSVSVPLPNGTGENGTTNAGLLDIVLPSQEAADTLRFHVKRSERYGRLEQQVERAQADSATVDFLSTNPIEGMLWMGEKFPQASENFLRTQLKANPEKAATWLQEMGFDVQIAPENVRAVQAEAKLAALEAKQGVAEGQQKFTGETAKQRFNATANEAVDTLTAAAGLAKDSEDFEIFAHRAVTRLIPLYERLGAKASLADVTEALTPLMAKLTGTAVPAHHATVQARNENGQFTAAEVAAKAATDEANKQAAIQAALKLKNDKHRRLAGPSSTTVPVSAITKMPANASLYDLKKLGSRG